jgi:hypothetical protein
MKTILEGRWMLVCLGMLFTGCTSTSPVLLQLPSERAGSAKLPLKAGVTVVEKSGSQQISTIETCAQFGLWKFFAKMPRRSEVEYFSQSVGDYFRDTKTFSYCYDDPFDRNDVDLVVRMRAKDLKIENTALGTTVQTLNSIPYIGLCSNLYTLVGGRIETFKITYSLEMIVETPSGEEISRYEISGSGKDGVDVYEQPFGNYMWYDSIFQKEFFKAMDYFVAQMMDDRSKIMGAIGK